MLHNIVAKNHVNRVVLQGPPTTIKRMKGVNEWVSAGGLVKIDPYDFSAFISKNAKVPSDAYGVVTIAAFSTANIQDDKGRINQRVDAKIEGYCSINVAKAPKLTFRIETFVEIHMADVELDPCRAAR